MNDREKVPTSIGSPVKFGKGETGQAIRTGAPPIVFQAQTYGYIPLETPEQLRQWEADARTFYGVDIDASRLAGVACETCSCGCSDDSGIQQMQ
jgi:hypothetical protein